MDDMEDRPNLEALARRALEFGEQRFLAGDIDGATCYAQYALGAAPGLAGAEHALVAYAVHTAAAAALGAPGAPDWYAVLGLPRPPRRHQQQLSGDDGGVTHDAIKRQHRILCLLVHPDKNTSAAADGAFKLVQAAYDALSAVHPPQPAAADRLTSEEEVDRFWETAADDDITPPAAAPKQPPIARPRTCRAAPPEGPPLLPAPSCQAQISRPLAPGQPQRPSCPLSPYCLFCRSYTDGAQEGFSVLESRTVPHGRQNGLLGFGDHGYCFY